MLSPTKPAYPIQCLPPLIRDYAYEIMDARGVPADLVGPAILATAAAAVQGVADVMLPFGDVVPTSINSLIIGESGTRVSPVLRPLREPFEEFEAGGLGKPYHQFLVESSTDQGIVKLLSNNARSILFSTGEGSELLPKLNFAAMCKRFDGDSEHHNSKSLGSVFFRNRRSSFCVAIQEPQFNTFYRKKGEQFIGSGFAGRCLVSSPRSNKGFRDTSTAGQKASHQAGHLFLARVRECLVDYQIVLEEPALRKTLKFAPQAQSSWWSLERSIEIELRPSGWWSDVWVFAAKAGQIAGRIAAVLQFFTTGSTEVEEWAMAAASTIMLWHLNVAKSMFGEVPPEIILERDAQSILETLMRLHSRGYLAISKSVLQRTCAAHLRNRELLSAPLFLLQQRGAIAIVTTSRSETIYLRPQTPNYFCHQGPQHVALQNNYHLV